MLTARIFLCFFLGLSIFGSDSNRVSAPQALPSAALENLFSLSPRLYSSGSPETESAFEAIRKLGISTIISVDGAPPNAELAKKYGLRYVHLPMGYDGASETNTLRLVKAAELAEGGILVHCHHGKHRGPAAAALIARATEGWDQTNALSWLKLAGTSPDYPGLFKQVGCFEGPTPDQLRSISPNLPERAAVSGLVEAMVEIDHRWENLQAVQKAGFRPPPQHPDLAPAAEALLLSELYRELLRSDHLPVQNSDLRAQFVKAEQGARDIHAFLKSNSSLTAPAERAEAEALWKRAAQSCADCHKKHRN